MLNKKPHERAYSVLYTVGQESRAKERELKDRNAQLTAIYSISYQGNQEWCVCLSDSSFLPDTHHRIATCESFDEAMELVMNHGKKSGYKSYSIEH
ncbi:MAG: hypothetical protein ABL925_17930 [Methylococcales bacterium]